VTAKSQEDYYNKVRVSEEGWASTNEGQIEFQKIVNEGGKKKAKLEEADFTAALERLILRTKNKLTLYHLETVLW
jgi:hypothetical protein